MTHLAKKCLEPTRGLWPIKPLVKDTWAQIPRARTRNSAAKMKTGHFAAFQRFESLPSYLGLPSPGNCFKGLQVLLGYVLGVPCRSPSETGQ